VKVIWLRRALLDMQRTRDHIRPHNPAAALKVRARLRSAVEHLETFPRAGRIGRKPGTREIVITEYPYIIRYRITADQVQILRIFHAAMAWTDL
jgi:toxin ParE1/3/4